MARNIEDAVREVCLSFPEAAEVTSHGRPDFRVRGKSFASFMVNHHGDGRIALWLRSPPGAQELHTETEPEHYFVPPYVGPRGWLGVHLDQGLDWRSIANRVREAYEAVAPAALAAGIGETVDIEPPEETLPPEDFDPMERPRAKAILGPLRDLCLAFPETTEATQFGSPCWRAGKKSFCGCHHNRGRLVIQAWVGAEQQAMLTFEDRYHIPPYMGHNGWINLDVEDDVDWDEVGALVDGSYRHFALKRMLKALDGAA